jgi:nicotinamidase-related amidase
MQMQFWGAAHLAPEPKRSALLTIDVQSDFTLPGSPAEIPGTYEAVPGIARLVTAFRAAGRPVIHMVRLYREDGSNADLCRRQAVEDGWRVARPGSAGAEIVEQLSPAPLDAQSLLRGELQPAGAMEWIIYKPRWGAFFGTRLDWLLDELDVTTLVICGCNFPNCPRATLYEASERDFRIILAWDAISGLYERGRKELENIGVQVASTEQCVAWLKKQC